MSMLAERRRKTKSFNLTGSLWSDDKNKFGQRILEKMGWKKGCGLGSQLQGRKEYIRVSAKSDKKGLGFKSDEAWFSVQEEYENLLSQISAADKGGACISPPRERKSLEEISRSSRTRIHYAKFIRGKDMSRYSEKDLACIFGKPLSQTEPQHLADISHAKQPMKISECSDTLTTHPGTSETFDEFETVRENTENMGYIDVASMENILNCSGDEGQNMCKKEKKKKNKSAYEYIDRGGELRKNSLVDTCGSSRQLEAKDSDTRIVGFVDNDRSHSNQYNDHDVDCIGQKVKKKSKRKDSFHNEQYVDQNEQSIDSVGDQQRLADCIKCCRPTCGQIYDLNSLTSGSELVADYCYSRLCHKPTHLKRKKKKLKKDQNGENNVYSDLDPWKTIEADSERKKKKHLKKDYDNVCVSDESIGLACDSLGAQCVESKSDRKQDKRKKKHEFERTSQSHDSNISNVSEYSYKPSRPKSKLSSPTLDSRHFNTDDTSEKLQKTKYEVDVKKNEPCKKISSSKNQAIGLIRNEERCSSYPSDHSKLDDCNYRKGNSAAEDTSKGTSSDVSIAGKKKNRRKTEKDSFSETLQVQPLLPIRHMSMVDLNAFKGSNWADIKGYGNYIPNMQNRNS